MKTFISGTFVALWLVMAGVASAQDTTGSLTGRLEDSQGLATAGRHCHGDRPAGRQVRCDRCRRLVPHPVPDPWQLRRQGRVAGIQDCRAARRHRQPRPGHDREPAARGGRPDGGGEVTGTTAVVDTTSTTTGAVLSAELLQRVPVGRRFTDALYLAPGVSSSGSAGTANPSMSGFDRPRQPLRRGRREHHQHRLRRGRLLLDHLRLARHRHAVRLRPGNAGQDRRLRGGVRPVDGRRGERRHQERHQRPARVGVRLLPAGGARGGVQDLRVAERHGEHRRPRAAPTPASRAASRSCGTSCSSSAPSTRRGRTRTFTAPDRLPAAQPGRGRPRSPGRRPTPRRAPFRPRRATASTRRSSATRPRATWARSAPRR